MPGFARVIIRLAAIPSTTDSTIAQHALRARAQHEADLALEAHPSLETVADVSGLHCTSADLTAYLVVQYDRAICWIPDK